MLVLVLFENSKPNFWLIMELY